jgi:S-formylglutathione hydrolase FrmB
VLTGYPGSAPSLVTRMNYPGRALSLVQHHRAVPAIYVMLSSTVAPPRDTECMNIPHGPQAETFLSSELTSAVDSALRVEPGHWGIVGDSTGGYCAAKLAMLQPNVYAGGVSLSGYYHALPGGTAGDIFGGSVHLEHESDLRWLLKHRPAPPASLFVTISEQETYAPEGYPETMRFLHLVKPPMQVTALIEKTGGHNFYVWERELTPALTWLSARMTAPTSPKAHHHHKRLPLHRI